MYSTDYIEHLYKGFCATQVLWKHEFKGLIPLGKILKPKATFSRDIYKKQRLGHLAEQFTFNQLEVLKDGHILAENLQIQKEKQTLGELDAIIQIDQTIIHLEIVYKFYLFDDTLGDSEFEQWIGPNRKDSLFEKISKLKNKQFPLLYSQECKPVLKALNLTSDSILQRVLFKAQLFIPYQKSVRFDELNQDCVCGFYINKQQLEDFRACEFYLPSKLDWFLEVNDLIEWLDFETFKLNADCFLKTSQSPLIWMKTRDGSLLKCFLVWW